MSDSSSDSISRGHHTFRMDDDKPYKGPTTKRSCTDAYCFFIFFGFMIGWGFVAYYVYWNGDIDRLYSPTDSNGKLCGIDPGVKDKKYLVFFDIAKCVTIDIFLFGCPTRQVCVEECPNENWFSESLFSNSTVKSWKEVQKKLLCVSESDAASVDSLDSLRRAINNDVCAPYYLQSFSVFGKICLPDLTSKIDTKVPLDLVESGSNSVRAYFYTFFQTVQIIQQDLMKCWKLVAIILCASVLACLFFIIILGILAKVMVGITFLLIIALLCCCTLTAYIKYRTFDDTSTLNTTEVHSVPVKRENSNLFKTGFWLYDRCQELTESREFWSVLTIISGCCAIAFIVLIVFLRKRISLAIMIITEGSKAVNDIKSTLLFPIIPLILKLFVITWFVLIFGFLKTLGNSVYIVEGLQNDTDCSCSGINYKESMWCLPHQFSSNCHSKMDGAECKIAKCKFLEQRSAKLVYGLYAYNFYGLLWGLYFVSGFGQMILSYCFALWYWTLRKKDIPYFTLFSSFYVTVRYHLGTVAVGSFLISALSFARSILEYIHKNLKGHENLISQCIFWSLRCCFWILHKFLTYVSANAYTMCAIYGGGFWSSAQSAVGLLLRNIIRVVVLDKVVDFLILMGKIGLTFTMGLISYYTFINVGISYPWVPITILVIVTWIIASTFFSVYTVAVDTLFLCFLKDGEINDGSQEKPYYMSSNLKYVLNNKHLTSKKKKVGPR